MAAQVFTATTLPSVRSLPDGINIVTAKYVATATFSASDVITFMALPEGAVVIDGYVSGKVGTSTAGPKIKLGVGAAAAATDADLIASASFSATTQLFRFSGAAGLPYPLAAIAAATYPKQTNVIMTCSANAASPTASCSFQVTVIYVTAGQGTT